MAKQITWVKEKFYRPILIQKFTFIFKIILIYIFFINLAFADLKKDIINKIKLTETLSFDFKQKVGEKEEIGNCFIKYPLKIKCNYQNLKKKIIISNGKTIVIIKKKYKRIYRYPIKKTPFFTLLQKDKILNIIKNNDMTQINANIVKFEFSHKKKNTIKIFFDKKTLTLKGWETKDPYSNNVSFIMNNVKINNQIVDDFFKIPKESDL